MLQDLRKSSQGPVAKVVVGLIIVTFALFGVDSIVGSIGGDPEVATVNGEGITEAKFNRALEGKRRQILSQMGERADPDLIDAGLLRSSVLDGMINESILIQDAMNKELFVADVEVDNYIRGIDQFKVDGQFSNERMQMVLRNAGFTLKSYRDSLKSQFVLSQPRTGLIASAFVLESEQKEVVSLDRQMRTFGSATIVNRDYFDAVSILDEELDTYYQSNKSSYKKPENVDVSFIVLDKDALLAGLEIDEEKIQDLYEVEKESFVGEEERVASHILIKIDDDNSEEQALSAIQKVSERLAAGEGFESLAIELSEDEGSAGKGGDLGQSGKGVYVSDFELALYALEEGQVSEPVKTEFGYHLIKLRSVVVNDIPSFEEMKNGLMLQLKGDLADEKYAELGSQLADITYSSSDLADAAEELSLEIQTLAGVSSETTNEYFASVKVQRHLLADELVVEKNNSELIDIDETKSIVFRVNAYHEASVLPLDEVSDRIREVLRAEKATEFAVSVGQAFIARVNGGEDPVLVSKEMGLNWAESVDVKRNNVVINREVVKRVFSLSAPDSEEPKSTIGFNLADGSFAILRLDNIKASDDEITPLELYSIGNMLSDNYGAGDYRNYQVVMTELAEIERL